MLVFGNLDNPVTLKVHVTLKRGFFPLPSSTLVKVRGVEEEKEKTIVQRTSNRRGEGEHEVKEKENTK